MPFCPDKKLPGQKNIWTNCFVWVSNAPRLFCLYYFLSIWPLMCCIEYFLSFFYPIVQQTHGTYFRFFNSLGIFPALKITTCLIKLWSQLTNIPFKFRFFLLKYGRDCVLKVIQQRLTQWPHELFNNQGVCKTGKAITGQLN